MIKVDKDTEAIPAGLLSENAKAKIAACLVEKNEHSFSGGVYGHGLVQIVGQRQGENAR
ncbi:MAG: hypothetical protein QNK37_39115 [Acidobacteriota bacterium]|nr:hypothetical protein [Acidobacteriota bacterium]